MADDGNTEGAGTKSTGHAADTIVVHRNKIIQRELGRIVQRLSNDKVVKSGWESVLQASPIAIEVMGMALVASSSNIAATIPVDQTKKTAEGDQVVLPYKTFKANLQECADLGRKAFSEAQAGMNELCQDAAFIISRTGPVCRILSMLDDPAAAKHGLRPQMDRLTKYAESCELKANGIKEKFTAWLEFTEILQKAGGISQGETRRNLEQNTKDMAEKQKEVKSRQQEQFELEKGIKLLENTINEADNEARKATEKVDMILRSGAKVDERLFNLPPMPVRETRGGLLPGTRRFFFGKNDEDIKWNEDAERRYQASLKARNEEAEKRLDSRRKELERVHKASLERAALARQEVTEAKAKLEAVQSNRTLKGDSLLEISQKIHALQAEIGEMGDKALSFENLERIVADSVKYLMLLKEHIQTIADFFTNTAAKVKGIKSRSLEPFLEEIHIGIDQARGSRSSFTIERIELYEESRELILTTALEIQAEYFVMQRLSGLYVSISQSHIMSGIGLVDQLAFTDPSETANAAKLRRLNDWSRETRSKIEHEAADSQDQLISDMSKSVKQLEAAPPVAND